MTSYDVVDTDAGLNELVSYIRAGGRTRFAVDMEGENNLHCYGIHVALVQIYDGSRAFIVDVLSIRARDPLLEFLRDATRLKVMFDAANDMLAFQHDLAVRPGPVLDVAIAARLLDMQGGLEALVGRSRQGGSKGKLQRSNWMKRPLTRAMLDYAISDVLPLLDLADSLMTELSRQGLMEEFRERNSKVDREMTWKPLLNFTRVQGYARMSETEKRSARILWYAREYYARRHNVPPDRVATKQQLGRLAARGLDSPGEIARYLNAGRERFRIDPVELAALLAEAKRDVNRDRAARSGRL